MPQIYHGDRQANAYTRHEGASTTAASIQVMPPDAHMTYTSRASNGIQASRYPTMRRGDSRSGCMAVQFLKVTPPKTAPPFTISRLVSGVLGGWTVWSE